MKYTNKHLKESYRYIQVVFYISMVGLVLGTILLLSGFICAKRQMDNIKPLEDVLSGQSNNANKTAYIEIIKVPEKISEDKYEEYYLVTTNNDTYISGMQAEQFQALKKEVEENGEARLEGFTKVIIDKQVIEDVKKYLNEENIHIRVTKLTYGNILKEGYSVNLILGGILALFSAPPVLYEKNKLKKQYNNPQAQRIDEECNHKDAIWLGEYQVYLTNNFIVTTYNGISAIDIRTVIEVNLFDTFKDNRTIRRLEGRTIDNKTIKIYETSQMINDIYEEEINYLNDIFSRRNINFKCGIETYEEGEYED